MSSEFTQVRVCKPTTWGVMVELIPLFSDGVFLYGSCRDKLFRHEYPEGFCPSWVKPFTVNDSRKAVVDQVYAATRDRALEYAKSLGLPMSEV